MSLFRRNPESADDARPRDAGEEVRQREQRAILRESASLQREQAALERQIEMDRRAGALARREASQLRSETRLKRKLQALKQRFGDLGLSHSGELVLSPEVRAALSQAAMSYRTARGLPAARPIEPPPAGRAPTLHEPCDVDLETRAAELRRREQELNLRAATVAAEAARLQEWAADLDREAAALAVRSATAAPLPGAARRPPPPGSPSSAAGPTTVPQGSSIAASRVQIGGSAPRTVPPGAADAVPVPTGAVPRPSLPLPLPAGFAFRAAVPPSEPPPPSTADSLQTRILELERRIEAATSQEFHRAAVVADVLAKSLGDLARIQAALRAEKS